MRGILLLTMVLAACSVQAPRRTPSEAMERSARILRQLDRLEADLHESDSETQTYAELVQRHARAQEIACKVTDEHVSEIHRLAVAQEEKLQQKRQSRQHRKKAIAQLRAGYSKS
ncbi:MAG: hypothetical protein E6J88_05565 [Deltaproteobacteria bacterium]|nr:MAG: hypothetical protein E6J88_05565 [Deltaproteobacteria bacterium]